MIQTPQIYQYYIDTVETKRANFKKEIVKLEKAKAELFKSIDKYAYFINTFSNVNMDELDGIDEHFKLKCTIDVDLAGTFKFPDVEKAIKAYIQLNKEITRKKEIFNKDKFISITSQTEFNFILKTYNKLMVKRVVEDNVRFHLGAAGCLRVRKRKRTKLVPNWFESNKNKKKLIDEGKLPFKTIGEDENGNPITNGGVPWLVYYTGDYYPYYYWDRSNIDDDTLDFLRTGMYSLISYTPTKGENSIVSYLNEYIREHPYKLNEYYK